jgi:hypothetical protein
MIEFSSRELYDICPGDPGTVELRTGMSEDGMIISWDYWEDGQKKRFCYIVGRYEILNTKSENLLKDSVIEHCYRSMQTNEQGLAQQTITELDR